MSDQLLVFYGSYRSARTGIRLADYAVRTLNLRGFKAELIDARALALPMLNRMYKEYAPGEAPEVMETLARKIRRADGFVFVTGEYNRGPQPGLKNLTDHFLEEWFWRPAGIVSYSAGRLGGTYAAEAWHATLSEMGMIVVSSRVSVGNLESTLDEHGQPLGDDGASLERAFKRFTDDLGWWVQAGRRQRDYRRPPF